MKSLLLLILLFIILPLSFAQTDGFKIVTPSGYTLVNSHNQSRLYTIQDGGAYDKPVYLLDLHGTHYQMGYDYGVIFGSAIESTYQKFLANLIPKTWEQISLEFFLDWQWTDYLSLQITQEFRDELRGLRDAGIAHNYANLDVLVQRIITISNFPGDVNSNIEWLLINEADEGAMKLPPKLTKLLRSKSRSISQSKGMQCSFFAVWGNRTESGQLFSMRNLDWDSDTGINDYKLITVWHPTGKIAYATVGFAGVLGALTGISSEGLTVHEAGNDVTQETFLGFTWTLRLRYVMENARNLNEALNIWFATNNTLGMNHMISSSNDNNPNAESHPAVALETMSGITAVFQDNDEREAELMWHKDGKTGHLGAPLPEALWRTNHGYDPDIVFHQVRSTNPNGDTATRYNIPVSYTHLTLPTKRIV
eukprot:TRINITY_DN972_c0_g1_i1.p1 TRINITY_DN972_c0_g1~~TRINITY_DN972_c0_g1_i1.p1  ORF type:complete len:422 (-),score=61.99 TRINITY_DN972_c0_g1_i1:2-1267(-)